MTSKRGVLVDTNAFIYCSLDIEEIDDKLNSLTLENGSLEASTVKEIEKYNELRRLRLSSAKLLFELSQTKEIKYSLTIFKEFIIGLDNYKDAYQYFDEFDAEILTENIPIMILAASRYKMYLEIIREHRKNNDIDELLLKSKTIANDCIIGATAKFFDLAILTNNPKDFRKWFPEVELIEI